MALKAESEEVVVAVALLDLSRPSYSIGNVTSRAVFDPCLPFLVHFFFDVDATYLELVFLYVLLVVVSFPVVEMFGMMVWACQAARAAATRRSRVWGAAMLAFRRLGRAVMWGVCA